MSFRQLTGDEYFVGDSDTWGGPQDGVDLQAQAGVSVGSNSWHTRVTIEMWTLIIIVGALAALWVLGASFNRVNVF